MEDDLAVGFRLGLERRLEMSREGAVVVDFAVDAQRQLAVFAHERLSSRVCTSESG